jgi:molybdopterin molybdotransferase
VLAAAAPLPAETLPLAACRGRALREDIRAPHALPPFRNSAMDGFAVRAADLAPARESQPVRLPVAEVIAAGPGTPAPLPSGAAARIMTGACLPEGADAVVPFEETASAEHGLRDAGTVAFVRPVPAGANVRDRGLDLAAGDAALGAGRELSAHDLALLAALGVPRVAVGAPPRAIVLSTGDELLAIEAALEPGRIRDSNSLMLALLLEGAGATVTRCERLRDDPDRVRVRLAAALADADVVLTIGGVSMGDFDPVRDAIAREPWIELWRVAMRPGQPQAFGARDGRLFFGLPGNPASVACVFETLVRPALRVLQGFAITDRPRLAVRAAERVESRGGRTDFVRARLERRNDAWWARPCGAQISGHLTPQSRAHALLVVSEAVEVLEPGDAADALILRWPEEGA